MPDSAAIVLLEVLDHHVLTTSTRGRQYPPNYPGGETESLDIPFVGSI